ncbi:NUDIX domain-containing protein [Sphingomonas jatrophae]|uniref:Predicted NTP pyrophosphohydrolase, NUDIX family n=1 Tax=Sphingomonas jatrophae TaxID=1166337 RepID=A0A1I6JIF6_9SPHN|nr:NUDIX domain-containing protein [Sphingomonas jatrophae]SFR78674.1 Predicted NTP pyrophosphohydrolase, NUDIX family [Sphingomonas jatrophae]
MTTPPPSAGILLWRRGTAGLEVLLAHPGGPYWRSRDQGAWQLPKGRIEAGETAEEAALREAHEELGAALSGELVPLGSVRQAGGKQVEAFALEGSFDPQMLAGNRFPLEWPPRSGQIEYFPEVDAVRWFSLAEADAMMLPSQRPFLNRLAALAAAA